MSTFGRYDGSVRTSVGEAIAGASIAVLNQPANTSAQPGSPLATIWAAGSSNAPVISAMTWLAGFVTVTLSAPLPADIVAGAYVSISNSNPTGYNGIQQIAATGGALLATQFTFALSVNPGTYVGSATIATSALPNPLSSDSLGNFFFYVLPGTYTVQIYTSQDPGVQLVLGDQPVIIGGAGTGTVTSVALTMPAEFSVAGSPISTTGTFAITKANQNANVVYAGPSSGGAAAPSFRSLVTADLPATVGTVKSVTLTCEVPAALLAVVVSGSPITATGTIDVNISLANQSANTVLAGPTSGGAAAPAFRSLIAADLPGSVLSVSITNLSSANLLALLGTPITLVAAQGGGKTIVPVLIYIHFTGGTVAYTDAGGAVSFSVGSLSQALASNAIFLVTTSPNSNVQTLLFAATATAGNPPSCDNAALQISKITNNFAAGNGTATITVFYLVQTT